MKVSRRNNGFLFKLNFYHLPKCHAMSPVFVYVCRLLCTRYLLSGPKDFGLEKTGNILATARNILTNDDLTVDTYPESEEETDGPKNPEEKFYSLFYKQNWNTAVPSKE